VNKIEQSNLFQKKASSIFRISVQVEDKNIYAKYKPSKKKKKVQFRQSIKK